MTGFGRGEASSEIGTVVIELKSVNHRFSEVVTRFPKELVALEERVRALVAKRVVRGRVDVFLSWEESRLRRRIVEVDKDLALAYHKACKELEAELGSSSGIDAAFIARFPDVLKVTEVPENLDAVWAVLETATSAALDQLVAMRETEGARLAQDLLARAAVIEEYTERIAARAPAMVEDYRNQLRDRLSELLPPNAVDEQRLAMEVAIFADRVGITEELVRLRSHCDQLRSMLNASEAIGRKLDFLLQEMNREINTTGSKVSDPTITALVIEVKSELEKIREQAQNIE
ncbi:MAG: YicC/YloC family endoribonuclease [Chloroflexota bacterium]